LDKIDVTTSPEKSSPQRERAQSRAPEGHVMTMAYDNSTLGSHGKDAAQTGISAPISAVRSPRLVPENYNPWSQDEKIFSNRPWLSTRHGRLAIRLFSRGVLGSMAYAYGNYRIDRDLRDYYSDPTKRDTFLQKVAYYTDKFIGRPIEFFFGKDAVTFRETRNFGNRTGRSLGAEYVAVTADFAAGSIGDGLGRNIARWFDPNEDNPFVEKGSFKVTKFFKEMGKTIWTILSFNQGEDWAVGIPYAYFMKAQRRVLNWWNPGFKYDFDHGMNGASFKVDDKGNIVGNYHLTGALDLQTRFTVYNIGTLMYREMYREVGYWAGKLLDFGSKGAWSGVKVAPIKDANLLQEFGKGIGEYFSGIAKAAYYIPRYLAKSAIKGTIFMTPSVPFFWTARVPQRLYPGMAIHPEKGSLYISGQYTTDGKDRLLQANHQQYLDSSKVPGGKVPVMSKTGEPFEFNPMRPKHDMLGNEHPFDPFTQSNGLNDTLIGSVGRRVNQVENWVTDRFSDVPKLMGINSKRLGGADPNRMASGVASGYVGSALAYPQYFMAKGEFTELYDKRPMGRAIYHMLDSLAFSGLSALKFDGSGVKNYMREFFGAVDEIKHYILHPSDMWGPAGSASVFGSYSQQTSQRYSRLIDGQRFKHNMEQSYQTVDINSPWAENPMTHSLQALDTAVQKEQAASKTAPEQKTYVERFAPQPARKEILKDRQSQENWAVAEQKRNESKEQATPTIH